MYDYNNFYNNFNNNNYNALLTIDEIIAKSYGSRYNNIYFITDCERTLTSMYAKNETLTMSQLDSLIKKMIKGRSSSLVQYDCHNYSNKVLNKLTERHMLTEKQISSLLLCMTSREMAYIWVDNLIVAGYKLSSKHLDTLISLGYRAGISLLLKNETATISDLNSICNSVNLDINNLEQFLKKFKIIPTIETINILVTKFGSAYVPANQTDDKYNKLITAVKKLIEYKLDQNVAIINNLFSVCYLNQFDDYINQLFENGIICSLNDIAPMFEKQSHELHKITNIKYMLTKFQDRNIILNPIYWNKLMTQIVCAPSNWIEPKCNSYKYSNTNSCNTYADCKIYFEICEMFLNFANPSVESLEAACLVADRMSFDMLINKLNKFSDQCVINVCAASATGMLNILINMKALPTLDCLKAIPINDNTIFQILLKNGLPLNYETLEAAFIKNLYVSNLSDYGITPGIELYRICYKYKKYPYEYTMQLDKNPSVNMDIRTAIDDVITSKQKSQTEIIEMIKSRAIIPDYMMYGLAVISKKHELVTYFEQVWEMKPNLDTLVLIDDLYSRQQYYERIIKIYNIPEDIKITVAKIQSPVITANDDTELNCDIETKLENSVTKKTKSKTIVKGKKKKSYDREFE